MPTALKTFSTQGTNASFLQQTGVYSFILFVVLICGLPIPLLAQSTLFTIEVTTADGDPLPGTAISGNHDISNLPGSFTDENGEYELDLRDLEYQGSMQPAHVLLTQSGYRFDPPELIINSENCPGQICSVSATAAVPESAIVQISFVSPSGTPIKDLPMTVSGSAEPCGKATDGYGNVYFSVNRQYSQCNETDQDSSNDISKFLPLNPPGYVCSFSSLIGGVCARNLHNYASAAITCTAAATVNSNDGYTIVLRDWQDRAIAGLELFVVPHNPDKSEFSKSTNASGEAFIHLDQVGGSIAHTYRVIPQGYYNFFPPELVINERSCPSGTCLIKAAPAKDAQNVGSVRILDSVNNAVTGVNIRTAGAFICDTQSPGTFSNQYGYTFFPVRKQLDCDNTENWSTFSANRTGCSFSDARSTPFQFCHQSSSNLQISALCENTTVETHEVRGYVFKPNGEPFPQVPIIVQGILKGTSRADGSYTVTVNHGESVTVAANASPYIFDPAIVEFPSVTENKALSFKAVASTDGLPDDFDDDFCEITEQYTVSGKVYDRAGLPVQSVSILNNHTIVDETDEAGNYAFSVPAHSDVWVSAEFNDEYFDPGAVSFPFIVCNQTEVNFQLSDTPSHLLAGSATLLSGAGVPELKLSFTKNAIASTIYTDGAGDYQQSVLDGTAYTISPNDSRYKCSPSQYTGISTTAHSDLHFSCVPDNCPDDPEKVEPGICGCGIADDDGDSDGTPDCNDDCPDDPFKSQPEVCGCGNSDVDSDNDGTPDCIDGCMLDEYKVAPGICGCGVSEAEGETDIDDDGTPDCVDACPNDPEKFESGLCGCGIPDTDTDNDETPDCTDLCIADPHKVAPGICGCGIADTDTDHDDTVDCEDLCPADPDKVAPGSCGCGIAERADDSDNDGALDCKEECPFDPNKLLAGVCGCGVADTDSDGDGTVDCVDECTFDPEKVVEGSCGCGSADTDSDGDGIADCVDECVHDPTKSVAGQCGCGNADTDTDGDGVANCADACAEDPNKIEAGICGCGTPDTDSDSDGTANCNESCIHDPAKTSPGLCGCGVVESSLDSDNDGTLDCLEVCDFDPNKTDAGLCGCGVSDSDSDADGTPDCLDQCIADPGKTNPGQCGCGTMDTDTDNDGTADCVDSCPSDPKKSVPGVCGCGIADTDSDNDGTPNCQDNCPNDSNKLLPGVCGCGTADLDSDGDGTLNCQESCPFDANKLSPGVCGCGNSDVDSDNDGTANCMDTCFMDSNKILPGRCGCGVAETDSDNDGTPDCVDACPNDPAKIVAGICGCGQTESDSDGDGVPTCVDECPNDASKSKPGACGCGVADVDTDSDGVVDCQESCPFNPFKTAPGQCGCNSFDTDSDDDGVANCNDDCQYDSGKTEPGACGCGVPDTDENNNGIADCIEKPLGLIDLCIEEVVRPHDAMTFCHVPEENYLGAHSVTVASEHAHNYLSANNTPGTCAHDANLSSAAKEKVTICHIPPGNADAAHTIEINRNALDAHLAHGDIEGPCQNDLPKGVLRWEISNPNSIPMQVLVRHTSSAGTTETVIIVPANGQYIFAQPNYDGTDTVEIVVGDEVQKTVPHREHGCALLPSTIVIEDLCMSDAPDSSESLHWRITNTGSTSVTGSLVVLNSPTPQVLALDMAPGETETRVTQRIVGENVLESVIHDMERTQKSHSLRVCTSITPTPTPTQTATPSPTATASPQPTATNSPPPTSTASPQPTPTVTPLPDTIAIIGGSLKGRRGRPLSSAVLNRLASKKVIIEVRNRRTKQRMNIFLAAPYTWNLEVEKNERYKIRIKPGHWLSSSKPRVYRKRIRGNSNGFHFALRSRDVRATH